MANRRSALKSTGPRTDAGKRRSSLNRLRGGGRSKTKKLFWQVIMTAPVGEVLQTTDRLMTHEQRTHPRIEALLAFHWSPQDILRPRFNEGRLDVDQKTYDRSLRLLYYQREFLTILSCCLF